LAKKEFWYSFLNPRSTTEKKVEGGKKKGKGSRLYTLPNKGWQNKIGEGSKTGKNTTKKDRQVLLDKSRPGLYLGVP